MRVRRSSGLIVAGVALAATVMASAAMVVTNRIEPKEMLRAPATDAPLSVRLSGPLDASLAGPIVAWRTGLFSKEGVQVSLTSDDSDAAVLERVSTGADAIGLIRSDTFLLARERGLPIVAFAGGYLETSVVFVAGGKGLISRPHDFIGKRMGYRTETDSTFIYEGLLAKLQIPRNLVLETPVSAEPGALLDGEIDIWPGRIGDGVPLLCPVARPCSVIHPADFGLHVPGSVYFSTEATLHDRPEDIRRFLRALVAGWAAAFDGGEQARQVLASTLEVKPSTSVTVSLIEQQAAIRPLGTRFAEYDEDGWRRLRQLMINSKMLSGSVDLSKAVTHAFLAEIYRQPVVDHQ